MKKSLLFLFIILSLHAYSQDNRYYPTSKGEIVKHKNYTLSYAEKHEQAEWVAYELTAAETRKVVERSDKFRPDPFVPSGSATLEDYRGSGYDRGHLAPAADMGFTSSAMNESFYMSNMSPQLPGFNRGIWKNLEGLVRSYAKNYEKVYVVTGPVLNVIANTIGQQVSIPQQYYKIVLRGEGKNARMIAFLLKNEKLNEPLSKFVVNTDFIEKLTGIDFFPQLPDDIEEKLEHTVDKENWYFKGSIATKANISTKTSKEDATTGRCCGTTKSGKRCSRKAASGSKYCWQHK